MRPQRFARMPAIVAAASLIGVVAGCGSSDGDASTAATTQAVESTETTAGSSAADTAAADPTAESSAADTAAADDGSAPATEAGTVAEECSADGSETPLDPLAGDVSAVAVRSESASSPLPDVTLRRINCNPGFVNLKNELPADTPVLFWFWTPF